jgi:hypothetical protein
MSDIKQLEQQAITALVKIFWMECPPNTEKCPTDLGCFGCKAKYTLDTPELEAYFRAKFEVK